MRPGAGRQRDAPEDRIVRPGGSSRVRAPIPILTNMDIKKITERGEMSTNLELYCAFTLYVDFIYILIRVIYFLLLIYGKSK